MTKHPNPKTAVTLIREAFKERGSEIQTKEAYNLLAQLWGYKDWPTASAQLDKSSKATEPVLPVYAHSGPTIDSWPIWVFCNKGGNEGEPLYVYPYGTRLDALYAGRRHWHLINDKDLFAMKLPDCVTTEEEHQHLHELFVGEEVACAYPDSEEYGFPSCANEREVHQFLQEELGWGYRAMDSGRPLVGVTSSCRGDDGAVEWWVEARVHPRIHERLLKATQPALMAMARAASKTSLQDFLASTDEPWKRGREVVAELVDLWFDRVSDSWSLDQLRDHLDSYGRNALLHVVLGSSKEPSSHGFVLKTHVEAATAGELAKAIETAWTRARESVCLT